MNEIVALVSVGTPAILLVLIVAAVLVVTFRLRLRVRRMEEDMERRAGYSCLSAQLAWDGRIGPADERINRILMHRAERLAKVAPVE